MSRAALTLVLLTVGCAHRPHCPGSAPRLVQVETPALLDDLPLAPLLEAAAAQAELLERSPKVARFSFGQLSIDKATYIADLRHFVALGRESPSQAAFF